MIEDVYEPLVRYRDEFKEKFANLAYQKFRELSDISKVDVIANRKTIAEINELDALLKSEKLKRLFCGILIGIIICALIVGGIYVYNERENPQIMWYGYAGIFVGLILLIPLIFWASKLSQKISELESIRKLKIDEAWAQMAPLNKLYTWDITVKLIEATVPRLAFDPYFTQKRLDDLKRLFGWSDDFNGDKSIIFAQSGVINGNPFLFGQYRDMNWGTKTYVGYKTISWSEYTTGADGKRQRVTRTQTLSATVSKPIPEYSETKLLIYGNDAASNLNFTRTPSSLSNAEEGFITNMRKKWVINRLTAHSRNLDDDCDFTLMSNHEFEALFQAKDRDNEVEFRLLYTPLAQTQTLLLLKDNAVGFGDDFTFVKRGKINVLYSKHLSEAALDTNPETFYDYDYDRAMKTFLEFNKKYFKDAYFAFAPLLSVPLYQQTRTYEEIYKGVIDGEPSSFWEHEAIANFYGDDKFKDSSCITQNILKTHLVSRKDGASTISVTAHGYSGISRIDYVSVFGGDGRFHNVPVEWVEYNPVQRTSQISVCEGEKPAPEFAQNASRNIDFRRFIYSYIK